MADAESVLDDLKACETRAFFEWGPDFAAKIGAGITSIRAQAAEIEAMRTDMVEMDEIVHLLGIEDSTAKPAETVAARLAEIKRLRAENTDLKTSVLSFGIP